METYKKFIAFAAAVDILSELTSANIETVLKMLIVYYASDIACVMGKSKHDFVDTLFDKVIADFDAIDELKKANLAGERCEKTSIQKRFEDDLEDGQQHDNLTYNF